MAHSRLLLILDGGWHESLVWGNQKAKCFLQYACCPLWKVPECNEAVRLLTADVLYVLYDLYFQMWVEKATVCMRINCLIRHFECPRGLSRRPISPCQGPVPGLAEYEPSTRRDYLSTKYLKHQHLDINRVKPFFEGVSHLLLE